MARSGTRRSAGTPAGGRAEGTRQALVTAAVEALATEGFAGASARSIAERAGCNQGLVFYHFGSVVGLLLAALDEVSALRLARYDQVVRGVAAGDVADLVRVARTVVEEDLDRGHMAVLAEMIAGASSTPGLAGEVADRLRPWKAFAARALTESLAGTPLAPLVPVEEASHAIVALYLGLEMLAHLDGDREPALALFDRAGELVAMLAALGLLSGPAGPAPQTTSPAATAPAATAQPKEAP